MNEIIARVKAAMLATGLDVVNWADGPLTDLARTAVLAMHATSIEPDSPFYQDLLYLEKEDRVWRRRQGVPEAVKPGDFYWVKIVNGGGWIPAEFTEEGDVGWLLPGEEAACEAFLVGARLDHPQNRTALEVIDSALA